MRAAFQASRTAGALAAVAVVGVVGLWTLQLTRAGLVSPEVDLGPNQSPLGFVVFVSVLVGTLIVARGASSRVGWILIALGLFGLVNELVREYAIFALIRNPGALPLGDEAAWLWDWFWIGIIGLIPPLLLYFPNGKLLSKRWRVVLWADVAYVASFVAMAGYTWAERSVLYLSPTDARRGSSPPLLTFLETTGGVTLALVQAGAAASLVVRYRRSDAVGRHQIKWLATASFLMVVTTLVTWVVFLGENPVLNLISESAIGALPLAIGVAILKYRLYDIDVVISRALVYGTLAGFITAIYVSIVVGIGSLIGAGEEPNLALSVLATALIALAFQPLRERVQKFANRLVYGKRSTPYEVLADFSNKMAGSSAQDELLNEMAATLADGTGAASAHVWINVGDQLRLAASFHQGTGELHTHDDHQPIPVKGMEFAIPHADHVARVVHKGELLGALAITKKPGEQITPVESKLVTDLASQAGVVLRNARLTEELLQRLEELKASRQRLVAAQDKARRRLERDLHDGAQQQLVALKVKLSLAQRITTQEKVKQFLTQLQSEADDTLQTLRDLARGIYPPLLADKGLSTALIAQANKSTLEVAVEGDVGRYTQEVEAAVYFCCLEALQNVAKYAGSCEVVIKLSAEPELLTFEVSDNGCGFDPAAVGRGHGLQNMNDRIDALGGTLSIESSEGAGTKVTGRIPARALEPAAA